MIHQIYILSILLYLIDCKNSKLEIEDYNELLKAWGFDKKHFLGSQERI